MAPEKNPKITFLRLENHRRHLGAKNLSKRVFIKSTFDWPSQFLQIALYTYQALKMMQRAKAYLIRWKTFCDEMKNHFNNIFNIIFKNK